MVVVVVFPQHQVGAREIESVIVWTDGQFWTTIVCSDHQRVQRQRHRQRLRHECGCYYDVFDRAVDRQSLRQMILEEYWLRIWFYFGYESADQQVRIDQQDLQLRRQ